METTTEPATSDHGRGTLSPMAKAISALAAIAVTASIGWWAYLEWPGHGRPTEPQTDTTADGSQSSTTSQIMVVEAPRIGPTLVAQRPEPIDFGHVAYEIGSKQITVTLRHAGGRVDPVSISNIRVVTDSAKMTAPVLDGDAPKSCTLGAVIPRADGVYCPITLTWSPDPGETLHATLTGDVKPFVSPDLIAQAATLKDRPGGWPDTSFSIRFTGTSAPAPAPIQIDTSPETILWEDTLEEIPRGQAELFVAGAPARIHRFTTVPPDLLEVRSDGETGCLNRILAPNGERTRCSFTVHWHAPPGIDTVDGQVLVHWSTTVTQRTPDPAMHTHAVPVRGTRKVRQATAAVGPDPKLEVAPPTINLGRVVAGTAITAQRIEIRIHDAPAIIEDIYSGPSAAQAGIQILTDATTQGDHHNCLRTFTPDEVGDWCLVTIEGDVPADSAPGPLKDAVIEIVWRAQNATSLVSKRDTIDLALDIAAPPSPDPAPTNALLSINPQHIDLGTDLKIPTQAFVTLSAVDGEVTYESAVVRSPTPGTAQSVNISDTDCREQDPAKRLRPGGFCDIQIEWTPTPGARLDATINILWRRNKERLRSEIPITAQAIAPTPTSPRTETRPPPSTMLDTMLEDPAALARAALQERRAATTFADGHGVIYGHHRTATTAPARRRYVDPDHSASGIAWRESTRPVDLTATVLPGHPIPVVLANRINATLPGPVVGMVESPVWGGHGRAQIMPPGTMLYGLTPGILGSMAQTGARAAPTLGPQITTSGARIDIGWYWGHRPDGSAFNLSNTLWTTDLMSAAGVPARVDPYEWETYINIISSAGLRALLIMAGPERNYAQSITIDAQGNRTEGLQHAPTKKELAYQELHQGMGQIASILTSLNQPPPAVIVPAGTRIRLYSREVLELLPIEDVAASTDENPPPDPAGTRRPPPTSSRPLPTPGPTDHTGQTDPQNTTQDLHPSQRPPQEWNDFANRLTESTAPGPSWQDDAYRAGTHFTEPTPGQPPPSIPSPPGNAPPAPAPPTHTPRPGPLGPMQGASPRPSTGTTPWN